MRIRNRLKAENEKKETITTPTCEVISVDNCQCPKHATEHCSWMRKKERKPRKRCSDGIKRENETGILINDPLLVRNSSECPKDDIKADPNLVIEPSCKRNRKNNVESIKEAVGSEMNTNVERVSLSGYVNEAIKEYKMLNPSETESPDISPDLEARCDSPVLTSRNICSSLQSDERPVFVGSVEVDINLMEKCDKDDGSANFSSDMKILRISESRGFKTYARRKKTVYDSSKTDSKSILEYTSPLGLTGQSRTGNTSSGCSGETLSGGCLKDVDEKILGGGKGTPFRLVEDVGVEKLFDGCVDLECAVGQNKGIMDMDNSMEKTTEGCFNKDKCVVDNLEEIIEQSKRENLNNVLAKAGEPGISPEDEAFDDECGKITPEEPVDSHSILCVSDSSHSRSGTSQVNTDVNLSPGRSLIASSRKKLLVLDLNGLIAEIIRYIPERHKPDEVISMKAVFKRPFYEDFLQFCFARFSVGVWSSRSKSNVQLIVDFLLGDAKQNLLFCWDQSHCTETGFYTVENREKPLLVKKLQKLWEKCEPDLPWKLGEYNEANTLMLDDSPYKALLNPPHTAIFPPSYRHTNKKDDSLGPGGALRIYLEGLASAEDVQKYVKENPFGQRPITEKNASWRFYQKVIEAILVAPGNARSRCSTNEPDWRQGIQNGKVDLNSTDKTLDKCPESREQRASDDKTLDECPESLEQRASDDRTLDECPESYEQRASGSPKSNRHMLSDMDRPHWRSGVQRRGRDRNSDCDHQRSSDYRDRYRFDGANRQDYGSRIQRWGDNWNRGYQDLGKRPVSDDQKAGGYSHGDSSFETKGSDWTWSSRGIQRTGGDWNRASRDLDKHPVSYDRKGSVYSSGCSSFDTQRSDGSRGIHRGGGGEWSGSYQPPSDQRPVSLDQRVRSYSHSNRYSNRGGGDWNRSYQPLDQRFSGYSCSNRYSSASFHWQAYR